MKFLNRTTLFTFASLLLIACGQQTPTHRASNPLSKYGALAGDVTFKHVGVSDGPQGTCQDTYQFSISDGTKDLGRSVVFEAGKPYSFIIQAASQYGALDLQLSGGPDELKPVQIDAKHWKISWTPPQNIQADRQKISAILIPKANAANAPICFSGQYEESFEVIAKGGYSEPTITIAGLNDQTVDPSGLLTFQIDAEDPTFDQGAIPELTFEYPVNNNSDVQYVSIRDSVKCVPSGDHGHFHYNCTCDLADVAARNSRLNGLQPAFLRVQYKSPHSHLVSQPAMGNFNVHFVEKAAAAASKKAIAVAAASNKLTSMNQMGPFKPGPTKVDQIKDAKLTPALNKQADLTAPKNGKKMVTAPATPPANQAAAPVQTASRTAPAAPAPTVAKSTTAAAPAPVLPKKIAQVRQASTARLASHDSSAHKASHEASVGKTKVTADAKSTAASDVTKDKIKLQSPTEAKDATVATHEKVAALDQKTDDKSALNTDKKKEANKASKKPKRSQRRLSTDKQQTGTSAQTGVST